MKEYTEQEAVEAFNKEVLAPFIKKYGYELAVKPYLSDDGSIKIATNLRKVVTVQAETPDNISTNVHSTPEETSSGDRAEQPGAEAAK